MVEEFTTNIREAELSDAKELAIQKIKIWKQTYKDIIDPDFL